MSTNLYWEQNARKKKNVGNDDLKFKLQKMFGFPVNIVLTESNISYLHGLADCDVDGADELIEAIKKYGEVIVTEEE